MIQIISNDTSKYKDYSKKIFTISEIDSFQSFDNYDITVIDISGEGLWYNKENSFKCINKYRDFLSINAAIEKSKNSKIIILFPQNINFYYYYTYEINRKTYIKNIKIKDMKYDFIGIINSNLISMNQVRIDFGRNYTNINRERISADFSFISVSDEDIVLTAENKNDIVAIKNGKAIITTLEIENEENMINLLKIVFPSCFDKKTEAPDWIKEIEFYTDKKCEEDIAEIDRQIDKIKEEKKAIEETLNKNLEYKSILYESGEVLSDQVNKMLSEIFEYDMSDFEDVYEEDGLIKLEDVTFVIETKGLNKEISGNNISDAYNHLIIYQDKLEEQNIVENAKCLFVVAYERNKRIDERCEIKERIEKIAKANNTLIIDTRIFLQIFENFLNGKIKKEEIKTMFKDNVGVLTLKKT